MEKKLCIRQSSNGALPLPLLLILLLLQQIEVSTCLLQPSQLITTNLHYNHHHRQTKNSYTTGIITPITPAVISYRDASIRSSATKTAAVVALASELAAENYEEVEEWLKSRQGNSEGVTISIEHSNGIRGLI
mmetsp:Transcript_19540/g.23298  ORF Transcript_19540/g.23298 Transcript_19540/m.23298 type:complete len:133 (-) Transcript_19540:1037-1435(-)